MSSIRLKHASGNSMSLAAPGTNPASNLELKLPHTIGSANQLLKVDGSGQLGWATDSTTDSTKLPLAGGTLTGTLNVDSGSNGMIDFGDTGSAFGRLYADSTGTFVGSKTQHVLWLRTNNVQRIKVSDVSAATSIGGAFTFNAMLTTQGDISGGLLMLKASENTNRFFVSGNDTSGCEVNLYDDAGGQKGIVGVSSSEFFLKAPNNSAPLTFYTHNGSSIGEKLRITSEGHVKILGQGQTTGFYLTNSYGQAGLFGGMYFNGSSWTRDAHASRKGAGMYINTGGHVVFLTSQESSGTTATADERMRLSSGGVLSIGGRDPAISANVGLEISGHATTEIRLKNTSGGWSTGDGLAIQKWSSGNSYFWEYDAQDILFGTSNSERIRIKSTGEVGIGTTTPQDVLDLGSSTAGRKLTFSNYSNLFSEYSTGSLWLASNFYGNAGATGYKVGVTGNYGASAIRVHGTGGGSNSGIIQFFTNDNASKTAGDAFTPTEHVRIDEEGHIRILNESNSGRELRWYNQVGGSAIAATIGWGNGNANWEFRHFRNDNQANNPYANIDFFTGAWSTGTPTRALRITNDGNHIREKHSRFATRIDYDGGNEAANSKIPFEAPHVNVGSDFDSSNERYVAPVDGDYAFWFHTNVARSGAGSYYATWMKNGSEVNSIAGGRMYDQHSGGGWNNLSGCLMINLDEGDYIEIFNGGTAVNYDGGNYGQWMGWLVG